MSSLLEMKKERLRNYYEAEQAVLSGQSYTIGKQTLNRANLSHIQKAIKELEADIRRAESKGRRIRRVIPMG